jgi:hypothetical protein
MHEDARDLADGVRAGDDLVAVGQRIALDVGRDAAYGCSVYRSTPG